MDDGSSFLRKCGAIFSKYISCNLLDAVIIAAANAIFLCITGMPFVVLISILAGIANMIPTVGPILGAAVGAILLLINKPINALWFILFTIVLQFLDSYLIRPKLFGNSLGVPSLVVLAATLLGANFFGIFGILFAVPVAAILMMLIREKRGSASEDDRGPGTDV